MEPCLVLLQLRSGQSPGVHGQPVYPLLGRKLVWYALTAHFEAMGLTLMKSPDLGVVLEALLVE